MQFRESVSLFLSLYPLSYHINLHMVIDCCARRLLSAQPDFQAQKSDIEGTIEMKSHSRPLLPEIPL